MDNTYKRLDYFDNLKFANLTEKAYYILEEALVTLELKPGHSYSENELSHFTNIGRTPVREAIKRLEQTRMLESIPRSGIVISTITVEEVYLQMEVRAIIEKLVLLRAAKFAMPSEREKLLKLADRYETATAERDAIKSIRIDDEFNVLVANCARNEYAKGALMPLQPSARRIYFKEYFNDIEKTNNINFSHIKQINAVAEGNANKVSEALDELFSGLKSIVISSLSSLVLEDQIMDNAYNAFK